MDTIILDILIFERLEPSNVWQLCLKNELYNYFIFKIVADQVSVSQHWITDKFLLLYFKYLIIHIMLLIYQFIVIVIDMKTSSYPSFIFL